MNNLETVMLQQDFEKEYEKFTKTQKEIIDGFKAFMQDVVTYLGMLQKKGRECLRKREMVLLQKKNDLTEKDLLESTEMEFNFRGVTCGIVDYVELDMMLKDLKTKTATIPNIQHYEGSVKKIIEEYS